MFRIFTQHTLMTAQLLCQIDQQRHWRTGKAWDAYSFISSSEYTCITWFHKEYLSSTPVQLIPGSLITYKLCVHTHKLKSGPYLSYTIRTIHCDAQFSKQNHKKLNDHAPRIVPCQDLMKIGLDHLSHPVYYCGFLSQPYILRYATLRHGNRIILNEIGYTVQTRAMARLGSWAAVQSPELDALFIFFDHST